VTWRPGRAPADAPIRRALAGGLVVALALGACGPGDPAAPRPGVSSGGSPGASPGASPGGGAASPAEITLAFAGDVHFAGRTLGLLGEPETAFGPVARVLGAADLAMVNLETAVTTRGHEEPKRFHFRAPPAAVAAVKAAGVDVVSLANNHALDYGRAGLTDTLDHARAAGLPQVGAGRTAESAYAPWITTAKGVRFAFLGMSQVAELSERWAARADRSGIAYTFDRQRATAAVQAAADVADVVIVYLHWGVEYNECPTTQMRSFARRMAAAGASIVVGTHAHVLLGDGWLDDTFVAYGLANFLWWRNDAGSNDTGVLRVTLRGPTIVRTEFVPAYIDRSTGQPRPVSGSSSRRILAKYAKLRDCAGLSDRGR
jgi:poly-gamma-glutamate synthesis protein (capsule biosynthesis protein)